MGIQVTDTAMAITRMDTIDRTGTMAIPRALRTTDTTGIATTAIIGTITTIGTKLT
jgi:hypothetical protein